jgi:hypothetical protein
MPKTPKPPVADQFSDDEMNQVKHYGQMLGGGVTPFDEAVEEALNKREAAEEASAKKMRSAQTGGGDQSLGPSQMDQTAVKRGQALNKQAATQAAAQAQQAQSAQTPVNAPPAPSGPVGATLPFPAQKGAVGGAGNVQGPSQAAAPPAARGPGGPPPPEEGEEGPPQ